MNGHILLVEDDPVIQEGTELLLQRAGLRVWAADDGAKAVEAFGRHRFDAVVLDIVLPSLDGLELGADDYVTKPFHGAELVARVRAALRRARVDERPSVVRIHDLEIDSAAFRVLQNGSELTLSATEFRLLLELARNPDRVLTRDVLLERVWSYDYLGDSRLVDMAIKRVRHKLGDDPGAARYIDTVRGVGYRFVAG